MLIITIQELKDIFYLIGSVLGIAGFFMVLKKRTRCELNYRTELGDEVNPFLTAIRGDIFNLEISDVNESFEVEKLPANTNLSRVKYKEIDEKQIDATCFFPIFREGETFRISNPEMEMPKLKFSYEDKFHNKYYQTFEFEKSHIKREERIKRKSRSCYNLSNRYWRFLWRWFPKIRI